MTDYQKVVVRPRISSTDEDPVAKALGQHGMTKFAGCPDNYLGASYDGVLGRYVTGLDETHPSVLNLPQEERLAKQAEIIKEREFLERELGVDLRHTNEDFWSTLSIVLDRGKLYDTRNPMDRVIVGAIRAGKIVPTSKEDIGNPDYRGTNFYIGTEYEDVTEKGESRARERKVVLELTKLLDKFDYAIEVGKYLGVPGISDKMPRANLDDVLSDFVEKRNSNKELFLDAVSLPEAHIRLANQFKEFKAVKLVKYEDGKWMSGKVRLGKTEKESVKKLLSADPSMQAELSKLLEDYKELTEK